MAAKTLGRILMKRAQYVLFGYTAFGYGFAASFAGSLGVWSDLCIIPALFFSGLIITMTTVALKRFVHDFFSSLVLGCKGVSFRLASHLLRP